MAVEEIRSKADEVAQLMSARFGGLRRGKTADLATMLRRRGGALPRKLRKEAQLLAKADQMVNMPKLGRQIDELRMDRAHRALVSHLRGVRKGERMRDRTLNILAGVVFGLMLIVAVTLWIMVRNGTI